MALVKCPECEREISNKAEHCPGCGNPMRPQPKVEYSKYQLSVPQGTETSYIGTLSRIFAGIVWIVGFVFAIEFYNRMQSFGSFLVVLLIAFAVGIIPIVLAQFFDDVHTIRWALQGMSLTHEMKKATDQSQTSNKEVYCTNCNKYYAKYYTTCPHCGQKR